MSDLDDLRRRALPATLNTRRHAAAVTLAGVRHALIVGAAPALAAVTIVVLRPGSWWSAIALLATAGLAVLTHHRLVVAPLAASAESYRSEWVRTQAELHAEQDDRALRIRLARALRSAEGEPSSLRIGLRAVAETAPDADVQLLLSRPGEPRIGWAVELGAGDLTDAVPVADAPVCAALTTGSTVLATVGSLEACAHLAGIDDGLATACLPLRAGEEVLGSICLTTAPGDVLEAPVVERIEWIVEQLGHRIAAQRADQAPAASAQADPLTGLPSAGALRPHLRQLVRSLTPFCLAVVEVEALDDSDDPATHDTAVLSVASALCETLRPDDLICRLDASRFAAVLPECSAEQAVAVMERVREHLALALVEDPFRSPVDPAADPGSRDDASVAVTCSAGVVESRRATSLDEIVEMASDACTRARLDGGNRVAVDDRTDRH